MKSLSPMTLIYGAGATALIATMILVAVSALGRHISLPLPGTVEIVEMLILVTAAAGILAATVARVHAAARLFIDHLSPGWKHRVETGGLLLGAIICLAITFGNAWLIYDVWGLHEASPLLGIPIVPFRILFAITMGFTCAVLLRQLARGNR